MTDHGSTTDGGEESRHDRDPGEFSRTDGGEFEAESDESARPSRVLQVIDAIYYALGIVVLTVAGSAVLSFAVGAGWNGVKFALFVVGTFAFGIASIQLRPKPAWREERRFSIEPDEETPFQATIQRLPPLSGRLDPAERLSVAARLFLGAIFTLATSFLMEAVLGVGVPTA
jgi:hypothetical protein